MKYGYFKDNEYVNTNPETPKSWINYLGTDEYCALIDNNAGGYSFYKSPKTGRVLRYRFNNIPMSRSGRYVYIKDINSKEFWSVSWQPKGLDLKKFKTKTIHGQGYTVIESEYQNIFARITYYVPIDSSREIWYLELENKGNRDRKLDIFNYAEFGLWNSFLDMLDFQYILYTARMSYKNDFIIYHHRNGGGIDNYAYFTSTQKVLDFDTDRETFIGSHRDESRPLAIEKGKCFKSAYHGGNPCASLRHRIILKKGQKKTVTYILGIGKVDKRQLILKEKYKKNYAKQEIQKIKEHWNELLNFFHVKTPDKEINVMANVWNQYQCHTTFKWSRSASFIEASGRDGLGYRDLSQDILGVLHALPGKVKLRIIDLLKGQVSDGSAFHQIQPLNMTPGKGEKPNVLYSDDHLWPILSISYYLKETGDIEFLKRKIPFYDKGEGTVLAHMRKAIDFSLKHRGKHKLCLGLYADWNDCLNLTGKGESVWTTFLLYKVMEDFLDIVLLVKRQDLYEKYRKEREEIKKVLNKYAWNGKWFNRAYLDHGEVVGSFKNKEGKIFLNPQSWAIFSGLADKKQSRSIVKNVVKHLETKYGLVLFWPAYSDYNVHIGSMTGFPKGLKENAGIFCHTNPWMVIADTILGNGDLAYKHFKSTLPSHYNDKIEKFTEAPYVYTQFITGIENKKFGRAENPWLTGTASWNFVAVSQHILGIRPDYNGLVIDPCIPGSWKKFEVQRTYRGAKYYIAVKNPKSVSKGIRQIKCNNVKVSNPIPVMKKGTENHVEVIMG